MYSAKKTVMLLHFNPNVSTKSAQIRYGLIDLPVNLFVCLWTKLCRLSMRILDFVMCVLSSLYVLSSNASEGFTALSVVRKMAPFLASF